MKKEEKVKRKGTTKYLKLAPSVSHPDNNPMKKKSNERTNEQEEVGAGRSCERTPTSGVVGGRLEDEPMNGIQTKKRKKRTSKKKFTTLNMTAHTNLTELESGMMSAAHQVQVRRWRRTRAAVTNQPYVTWCLVQRQKGEKGNIVGNHGLRKKEIRDAKVKFDRKRQ